MPVVTERAVRSNIDALLASVLIVFMAVLAIPILNALEAINRATSSGNLLTSPGVPMNVIFLLCIEAAIAIFVAYTGYLIISRDRRRGRESNPA